MKESIDLTENRDFRNGDNIAILNQSNVKNIKSTPWVNGVDPDLPASLKPKNLGYYYIDNMDFSINNINIRTDEFNNIQFNEITSSLDFDALPSTITNRNFRIKYGENDYVEIMNYGSGTQKLYYTHTERTPSNSMLFPTGNKNKIINSRFKFTKKHSSLIHKCSICGTKYVSYGTVSSHNCYKLMNNNRNILSKLKRNKKVKLENTYNSYHGYIPWRDSLWSYFYNTKPAKYVYYKGMTLRRRSEPWQPNGRIPQDYDELFDSLNWREMLQKRLQSIIE